MSRVGIRVAEGLGNDLDVDTGGEHQSRCDVAKVVKPDRRKAGGLHQALEEVADLAGAEEGAPGISRIPTLPTNPDRPRCALTPACSEPTSTISGASS